MSKITQLSNQDLLSQHNEWYSRGYLPHRYKIGLLQSVIFRLKDSLPSSVLAKLEYEFDLIPVAKHDAERRKRIENWLDSGSGCCALKRHELAFVMQQTLLKFDGDKYRLIAWCIMPNHVHVLIEPNIHLSKIIQSWKSFTGRWALKNNDKYNLGISGKSLWMKEYFDRFIRDAEHADNVISYIDNNPVKAKLCNRKEDWKWSSAGYR